MSLRYKGSVISSDAPAVSIAGASGVWTLPTVFPLQPVPPPPPAPGPPPPEPEPPVWPTPTSGNAQLWGCGRNGGYRLGLDDTTTRTTLTQIGAAYEWSILSAGFSGASTAAIQTNGTLWTWGLNLTGQLGQGDTTTRTVPTQVGALTIYKRVSMGSNHCAVIRTDGTLWTTGFNITGQLGLGDYTQRTSFTQVGTDSDWAEVSCGGAHTMAIKTNGTLWACGWNINGELGLGDKVMRNVFTQVGTATNWAKVSAGSRELVLTGVTSLGAYYEAFTSAVKTNGTMWAWGGNNYGQLGNGNYTGTTSPAQIGLLTNWAQVSSKGGGFSAAVKTDGTLWAWGSNFYGQLGLGNTILTWQTHRQVGTDTDWRSVSVGVGSMSAIKTNGTLWTCGINTSGELGLGDTTNRSTLTQVGSDTKWITLPDSQSFGTFAIKAV